MTLVAGIARGDIDAALVGQLRGAAWLVMWPDVVAFSHEVFE
jgi:hypothetical protein